MIINATRLRFPVFDTERARIVCDVGMFQARRMVDLNQARVIDGGRCLQLTAVSERDDIYGGRTHTTRRNELMAACGCGQIYTNRNEKGRVDGHKTIFPEDRNIFYSAVLTNIKALLMTLAPGLIMGWG